MMLFLSICLWCCTQSRSSCLRPPVGTCGSRLTWQRPAAFPHCRWPECRFLCSTAMPTRNQVAVCIHAESAWQGESAAEHPCIEWPALAQTDGRNVCQASPPAEERQPSKLHAPRSRMRRQACLLDTCLGILGQYKQRAHLALGPSEGAHDAPRPASCRRCNAACPQT